MKINNFVHYICDEMDGDGNDACNNVYDETESHLKLMILTFY